MATRLDRRIQSLRLRKSDATTGVRTRSKVLSKSEAKFDSAGDALEYISESMEEVEKEYTDLTFEQCKRVENQILEACETEGIGITFRHQGSVTSGTHIKFYSDIDLLVLTKRFYDLKSPLVPSNPYKGDPMADLIEIRSIVESRLESSFPQAEVDKTGAKAVSISGGSLRRKIDVISGAWLDTQEYLNSGQEADRGVKILDLEGPKRISNFPFLHNREIINKDAATSGNLKRLIRFVKSARYDSDAKIKFSSYDIASLCFHLPNETFLKASSSDYSLVAEFLAFSDRVASSQELQSGLFVPNKTRLLFCEEGASPADLKLLNQEILEILEQARGARSLHS